MKPLAICLPFLAASSCATISDGSGEMRVDAPVAFEWLRGAEGEWSGEVVEGTGAGVHPVDERYHVTAGGSVVEATVFRGTPRETVMMFQVDNGKLILAQYGEAGYSATLVGDMFGPAFRYAEVHAEVQDGNTTRAVDFEASPSPDAEPDGVWIRFLATRVERPAPSDGAYLYDVILFVEKEGTFTTWNFFKDGEAAKDVYVELTQRESDQAAADVSPMRPSHPH